MFVNFAFCDQKKDTQKCLLLLVKHQHFSFISVTILHVRDFSFSPEARTLKEGFSYNDRVRKGLIADFDRTRPADQCQLVSRVDLWYRLRVMRLF